jgi:hypothetical protein
VTLPVVVALTDGACGHCGNRDYWAVDAWGRYCLACFHRAHPYTGPHTWAPDRAATHHNGPRRDTMATRTLEEQAGNP